MTLLVRYGDRSAIILHQLCRGRNAPYRFGGHGGFVRFLGGGFDDGDFVDREVVELVNVLIDRGF